MKCRSILFFVFLFAGVSLQAQTPLDEPVTVRFSNVTLRDALFTLMEEGPVNLSFSDDLLPKELLVSGTYSQVPVRQVLSDLLRETALTFRTNGKQIVLITKPSSNQQTYTIRGTIEDRYSGEKLIGAHIYDPLTRQGTSSNAYGFYSLTLPEGVYSLRISYLGYRPVVLPVYLEKDLVLDLGLEQDGSLAEVEVIASPGDEAEPWKPGTVLDLARMNEGPALAGEPDVLRFSAIQPGIQTGTDGFGGIHVRGGNADQNLVLLDGVPVYNPSHAAGFFSIFSSPAVRKATVYKGGFPARYGGRLSSVYDIRMKEGNNKQFGTTAGIGLLAANASIEGPIDPEMSSFYLSARRSLVDPWLRGLTRYVNQEYGKSGFTDYRFYDINGKMNFRSGRDHRFYVSLYHGNDSFHEEEGRSVRFPDAEIQDNIENDLSWGNTIASFRWNWLLHPQWFVNTTVYTSSFRLNALDFYEFSNQSGPSVDREFDLLALSSSIQDLGLRIEGEFHPNGQQQILFGGNLTQHRFQPGVLTLNENSADADIFVEGGRVRNLDSLPTYPIIEALELDLYLEDEIELSESISAHIGVLSNLFHVQGRTYISLQPRISVHVQPADWLGLAVRYANMTQNLHVLTNSGLGLPTDLWVPVTGNIRPLQSRQIEASGRLEFGPYWSIEVGGYYKEMEDVLAFRDGANFLASGNIDGGGIDPDYWESQVTSGNGLSRGVEASIAFERGRWQSEWHYTYSRTTRRFAEINFGEEFPFRYDRRHVGHGLVRYQVNDRLALQFLGTYSTGNPITLAQGVFNAHSTYYVAPGVVYTDRNDYRMRDYHRIDLSANYRISRQRYTHLFQFGFYNVYNRLNPLFIRIRENIYNPQERELREVALLPILPILRYQMTLQ